MDILEIDSLYGQDLDNWVGKHNIKRYRGLFSTDSDERFREQIRSIFNDHDDDENEPDDDEIIVKCDCCNEEFETSDRYQTTCDDCNDLIDSYDVDAVMAYFKLGIGDHSSFEEAYAGAWDSDEEFVQTLLEDCGDIPKLPHYIHIDWKSTARDVMMDYCSEDGYYFRNV